MRLSALSLKIRVFENLPMEKRGFFLNAVILIVESTALDSHFVRDLLLVRFHVIEERWYLIKVKTLRRIFEGKNRHLIKFYDVNLCPLLHLHLQPNDSQLFPIKGTVETATD